MRSERAVPKEEMIISFFLPNLSLVNGTVKLEANKTSPKIMEEMSSGIVVPDELKMNWV